MDTPQEFHYRLPGRVSGQRPGSHPGSSVGVGQEFVTHARLFDRPDPRRLDLRASLKALDENWLVRVNRQRAGVTVRALVDVSGSMGFGSVRPKLQVVADFVEALGLSAFRAGDAVGMMAFDDVERDDLFVPARVGRGVGSIMAASLRALEPRQGGANWDGTGQDQIGGGAVSRRSVRSRRVTRAAAAGQGLEAAAALLAGQHGLIFLVSDFHWPLERLEGVLDSLTQASVIPVVVWDAAEVEPPRQNALLSLRDAESGAARTLWIRPKVREKWRGAVARRREQIDEIFAARNIRPFYMVGAFQADALSRYFFEADA